MGKIVSIILAVVIPIMTYVLVPRIVARCGGNQTKYKTWLAVAAMLYAVSWLVPSPLIGGKDTNFSTHVIGGGMFTGFLWYYLKQALGWKTHWLLEAFSLFALVSALGVANELFEIGLYKLHIIESIADTSWDLLANTLGAFVVYVGYILMRLRVRQPT